MTASDASSGSILDGSSSVPRVSTQSAEIGCLSAPMVITVPFCGSVSGGKRLDGEVLL